MLAFIICAQFFSQFAASLSVDGKLSTIGQLVIILVYVVFGLLLFYATRVGDGKAVKRFSPLTLIVLVLPTLCIIVLSFIASSAKESIPFISGFITSSSGTVSIIVALASVALGYGIPYTFLSGFELKTDEDEDEFDGEDYEDDEDDGEVLEGGVEADILEAQQDDADNAEVEAEENNEEAEEPEENEANEAKTVEE